MSERSYDIVLFGATGFTGKLVAEYLAARGPGDLRWALAGRSRERLEAVRRELSTSRPELGALPLEVADAGDRAALDALVAKAAVVCTTVGPYLKHGRALVAACAAAGTHYCDLTGEVPFVRAAIDEHHARAVETGARIVCCCGYDSIPSDLGVFMLHQRARSLGLTLGRVKYFAGESRGGFSGGTVASMLNLFELAAGDPSLRRTMANPHALDPDGHGPDGRDQTDVRYDRDLGQWTAPFVMAAVNTRVVRRSNALLGDAYGPGFRYAEAMSFGPGPKGFALSAAVTVGLGAFVGAVMVPPLRKVLAERVLPSPGEGPSKAARDNGFFVSRLVAETVGGTPSTLRGRVEGRSDPGYGETAKMLGESALCLARDAAELPPGGGVLTPASAMGARLLERLRAAGMTFTVQDG